MPGKREQQACTAAVVFIYPHITSSTNERALETDETEAENTKIGVLAIEQVNRQDFGHERFSQPPMDVTPTEVQLRRVRRRTLRRQVPQQRLCLFRLYVESQGPDVANCEPDGRCCSGGG